jgi:hypothetical protein
MYEYIARLWPISIINTRTNTHVLIFAECGIQYKWRTIRPEGWEVGYEITMCDHCEPPPHHPFSFVPFGRFSRTVIRISCYWRSFPAWYMAYTWTVCNVIYFYGDRWVGALWYSCKGMDWMTEVSDIHSQCGQSILFFFPSKSPRLVPLPSHPSAHLMGAKGFFFGGGGCVLISRGVKVTSHLSLLPRLRMLVYFHCVLRIKHRDSFTVMAIVIIASNASLLWRWTIRMLHSL